MKLLRTYHRDGCPKGYFDPATRCDYGVSRTTGPGIESHFVVDVYAGDGLRRTLSPPFDTEAQATAELDCIAALIEGKGQQPQQHTGIDYASGSDCDAHVIVDTETGEVVGIRRTEARSALEPRWVPGEPPSDGEWYLVRYLRGVSRTAVPGIARYDLDDCLFESEEGVSYYSGSITHHIPTPINLEVA